MKIFINPETEVGDLSIDELEEYIKIRKKEQYIPIPLENPDFTKLIDLAKEYIETGYVNDMEHWCYEILMQTIYGDKIFGWINKNK